jgi:hypothetical protein
MHLIAFFVAFCGATPNLAQHPHTMAYFVHWKNYDDSEDSWVVEEDAE